MGIFSEEKTNNKELYKLDTYINKNIEDVKEKLETAQFLNGCIAKTGTIEITDKL